MSQPPSRQSTDALDVTISGGSMGGLFTGIALGTAGHEPTIYEQSAGELRSRGGGIVAQENIRRFLDRHDVVDPATITTASGERRYLAHDGDVEQSRPESMVFTSWDAVYRHLRATFPDDRYHTGSTVVGVTPETATAEFADGSERAADLLVAAEGGQSTTREQLFPDVTPQFADYVAWRGLVPEADCSAAVVDEFDDRFTFYQGPDLLILGYFIPGPDGGTNPGERRLNWVWYDRLADEERSTVFTDAEGVERTTTVPPGHVRTSITERRRERAADVLPPTFETLVGETAEPFVQSIYDLAVPEIVVDRTCLLGDAAFVARPHTAAGTAKACGDGVALAAALDRHETVAPALSEWNDARTDYGARLVARGKRMGDERLGLGT